MTCASCSYRLPVASECCSPNCRKLVGMNALQILTLQLATDLLSTIVHLDFQKLQTQSEVPPSMS
jgi:hypothetical protein